MKYIIGMIIGVLITSSVPVYANTVQDEVWFPLIGVITKLTEENELQRIRIDFLERKLEAYTNNTRYVAPPRKRVAPKPVVIQAPRKVVIPAPTVAPQPTTPIEIESPVKVDLFSIDGSKKRDKEYAHYFRVVSDSPLDIAKTQGLKLYEIVYNGTRNAGLFHRTNKKAYYYEVRVDRPERPLKVKVFDMLGRSKEFHANIKD